MLSMSPCASCHCFVRAEDARCPFCGAVMSAPPPPRRVLRRSRAAWLAVGSSAAAAASVATFAACSPSGGVSPGNRNDGAAPVAVDGSPDVVVEAGASPGTCGDARCVATTEYCAPQKTTYCWPPPDGAVEMWACKSTARDYPPCEASTTCACIGPLLVEAGTVASLWSETFSCIEG